MFLLSSKYHQFDYHYYLITAVLLIRSIGRVFFDGQTHTHSRSKISTDVDNKRGSTASGDK